VAITALSGMDHMMDGRAKGSPYPHFSVRSEDFRYTLCSNGEEELYHHGSDPLEHLNLASSPEHEKIKQELRQMLIQLREGRGWNGNGSVINSKGAPIDLCQWGSGELDFIIEPSAHVKKIVLKSKGRSLLTQLNDGQRSQHWRARFDGRRTEIWVDGICQLDLKDAHPLNDLISIHSEGQAFSIRDLKCRKF
jgi:hypothetical protein